MGVAQEGGCVAVSRDVSTVPGEWKTFFPPPLSQSAYSIQPGPQDSEALDGWHYVSRYVLIDLSTGNVKSLIDAPTANSTTWSGPHRPAWSDDGKWLAIPDTFMRPNPESLCDPPSLAPCVAVV